MKLLAIGHDAVDGGGSISGAMMLHGLVKEGVDVETFLIRKRGTILPQFEALPSLSFGVIGDAPIWWRVPGLVFRLLRLARKSDVIFSLNENSALYVAQTVGWLARKPVVSWLQAVWTYRRPALPRWHWPTMGFFLRRAKNLATVSDGVRDDLIANHGVRPEHAAVLSNPIDINLATRLAKEALPARLSFPPEAKIVLGVGRLAQEKGYDVLLKAFRLVRQEIAEARLLIAGEGPERQELEALANDLGLSGYVQMPGRVANPFPLFKAASLFVLSSRFEATPVVLLEAMALGIPIVATACPSGPAQLLRDGEAGTLVAPEDPQALGQAIIQALRSVDQAKVEFAREVVKQYDVPAAARRAIAYFRQAIAN